MLGYVYVKKGVKMGLAALTSSELERLYQDHIRKESAIWQELTEKLIDRYLRIKANNEVLALMSKPRNVLPMPPKGEFNRLEFESLD